MDRQTKAAAITLILLLSTLTAAAASAQNWYNGNWVYRRPVTVSNAAGEALAGFQTRVALDSTFDFTHANADGGDLRVTAADGTTSVPFWVESWDATAKRAKVWVRVPSIGTAGAVVYLYYGNPAAPAASDGGATFEFFDDFDANTAPGYFALDDTSRTIMLQDQGWETEAPHTLSVVAAPAGAPYPYYGYYGLEGCGGIGVAGSSDLVTWVKSASNPLFTGNGERWPSVLLVDGVYHMVHTVGFCGIPGIVYRTSPDGLTWSAPTPLVGPTWGQRNQNPSLFHDPVGGWYYLYWYRFVEGQPHRIMTRWSPTLAGLASAPDVELLSSAADLAAPNMMYMDGTYFLSTETFNTDWDVRVFTGPAPSGPFTLLPGNPVLSGGCACLFQTPIDTTLYLYYCKETSGVWTLDVRTGSLTRPRPFVTELDRSKWTPVGGSWGVRDTVQWNGRTGAVAEGATTGRQFLEGAFRDSDFVIEAFGAQETGRMWGLGVNEVDVLNGYTLSLYEDLDGGDNLFLYRWTNGISTEVWRGAAGPIAPGAWYGLAAKVHADSLSIWFGDSLLTPVPVAGGGPAAGHVTLYGESGASALYDDVRVRKYAAVEPVTAVGPEFYLLAAGVGPGAAPSLVQLAPSRPNPFSGTTTLAFLLPAPAEVSLAVYDVQGRLVRRLAGGPAPAGWTRVTWDGRDASGVALSAGAYLVRLETGGRAFARATYLLR